MSSPEKILRRKTEVRNNTMCSIILFSETLEQLIIQWFGLMTNRLNIFI